MFDQTHRKCDNSSVVRGVHLGNVNLFEMFALPMLAAMLSEIAYRCSNVTLCDRGREGTEMIAALSIESIDEADG
jgi:hypothetical protein